MDTGGIAKPPPTALTAPARPDVLHAARGVATELPPEAAVQQAGESKAVQLDPSRRAAGAALDAIVSEFIKRNIEIDPQTRELVFQVVDPENGNIVRQTPDEAILRLRAYIRELRERNAAEEADHLVEKIA